MDPKNYRQKICYQNVRHQGYFINISVYLMGLNNTGPYSASIQLFPLFYAGVLKAPKVFPLFDITSYFC